MNPVSVCALGLAGAFYAAAASAASVTPEQAKAGAQQIIEAASAGDLFANVTDDTVMSVKHGASGMVCHFITGAEVNEIIVPPPAASGGLPRGDDVACATSAFHYSVTLYALRPAPPVDLKGHLSASIAAMRLRYPGLKPFKGKSDANKISEQVAKQFPHQTQRFVAVVEGEPLYTRISVAEINGWILTERMSGPLQGHEMGDLAADMMIGAAINDVGLAAKPAS